MCMPDVAVYKCVMVIDTYVKMSSAVFHVLGNQSLALPVKSFTYAQVSSLAQHFTKWQGAVDFVELVSKWLQFLYL